ncbi:hypothetical protein NN561_006584 [Cricetulus griseus]
MAEGRHGRKATSPLTSPLQASWAPRGRRRGLNGCTCGRLDAVCVKCAERVSRLQPPAKSEEGSSPPDRVFLGGGIGLLRTNFLSA